MAIAHPCHHLFTLCLQSCCIPLEWCIHSISLVFKCGDKSMVRNYRPISLLCNISKVLERLIYDGIIDTVSKYIVDSQFGFLQHRSTLQQLLIYFEDIFHALSEKASVDVIYLDLSKAFDSVQHNELLVKLWQWFQFYLSNRSQFVKINGQLSEPLPVISGVPQGSIFGPILFLIYINEKYLWSHPISHLHK